MSLRHLPAGVRSGSIGAAAALLALALSTSGFSSCAGATGTLFVPLDITPGEVLLRASASVGQEAIALARIDGADAGERYSIEVVYHKDPGVRWLTVEVSGTTLTLRASPAGLAPGVYAASVTVEAESSGASAVMQVEFTVIR